MAKNLTNNQILLNEILEREFEENNDYIRMDEFFEYYVAEQTLKNYDLSYEEIKQGLIGAGHDGGCDGFYLFLNGMLINADILKDYKFPKDIKLELFILQAKNTNSFNEDAIMKWKTTSNNLLQMANTTDDYIGRYNEEILEGFQIFKDLYIKLIRNKVKLHINYTYISKGTDIHPNVLCQSEELKRDIKVLFPSPNVFVSVDYIGADKLMDLISSAGNRDITLKLIENPIAIGSRKDYVCLVNLSDYFKFVTNESRELSKNIFESNVRDYQGNTSVNSEIQDTLVNESVEDFWWLNNGITILATEVIQVTGKEMVITDPEIVNGLQTSTEIYNYFYSNDDKIENEKRSVLVRVIVPETDESRDRIILATNSQTSIPKSSLRATDPIHRQIEMYFKTRGLYYDRRKNYYKNQGKKPADIVSVSFLAQCLMSILLQKPDYARARPSTLLTNDESYEKLYVENQNLDAFYNAAYIGKKVDHHLNNNFDYSTVEKGDILFYVIFSIAAFLNKKTTVNSKDLAMIDIDKVDVDLIAEVVPIIYEEYMKMGGTGKVAKSSELAKRVQEKIESKLV